MITVYWRPGCGFCSRLRGALDDHDVQAEWINIWEDPEAAAYVRSVANGNEVVPTVRIGDTVTVNPAPMTVIAAAQAQA
jgi:glutaredoxin-like protein